MEIKIKTSCEEENPKVAYFMKKFCKENFKEFKLYINGEEIKDE